jgi:hypothetical protein
MGPGNFEDAGRLLSQETGAERPENEAHKKEEENRDKEKEKQAATAHDFLLLILFSCFFLLCLVPEEHANQSTEGDNRPQPEADEGKQRARVQHPGLVKPIPDPDRDDQAQTNIPTHS